MPTHIPYHIVHIYLNEQAPKLDIDTVDKGNYLVFWWGEVVLGHLFLAPGSEWDYTDELIRAIEPSIYYYSKNKDAGGHDWRFWIRNKQFDKWNSWMETLFLPQIPQQIPPTVPVSAIICTRNRASQLQQCLHRIFQLKCMPSEIIVVDNASADDSSLKVTEQYAEVIYVKEARIGLDFARNTGIRKATSPVIAFVDDDVIVHPFWVYRVWETLQNPAIAAMTGLVIASELRTEAQCLFEKYWSFNRGYIDITYDQSFFATTLPQGPPVWKIGAGANMAFRKNIFEQIGYFDEILDVGAAGCNGDSEMWYRMLSHGLSIHYNPRAIVFHEHRKEIKELKRQIFYYMRGHAAAALIQQRQQQQAGYIKYLAKLFLKGYGHSIAKGFPRYSSRYSTLWAEISGALSGIAYYYRNKSKSNRAAIE